MPIEHYKHEREKKLNNELSICLTNIIYEKCYWLKHGVSQQTNKGLQESCFGLLVKRLFIFPLKERHKILWDHENLLTKYKTVTLLLPSQLDKYKLFQDNNWKGAV